jgi:hypothetical protein
VEASFEKNRKIKKSNALARWGVLSLETEIKQPLAQKQPHAAYPRASARRSAFEF